ncbi:MAG: glycine cleavage system protein GcvH [Firmicutes bacterium]|nr:glycine cleavage system protein GcvH [Bacillota bacterium]
MEVRKGLLYSQDHEWVKITGSIARIGITAYAQDQLGDVVFVELPSVDDPVTKDEPFTVVESVKAASDVYSPVTGVITAVNEDLEDSPELINESPYDEGWIIEVELDDTEVEGLMTPEEYEDFIREI